MSILRALLIIILVIIRLVSFIVTGIIYSYLKRKSPGMKTVLDELVQELIIGAIITSLLADIVTCGVGPVPVQLAVFFSGFWVVLCLSAQYWFMQIFVTFLVRYLYIFHATTINVFSDHVILVGSRLICITWMCLTCLYDYINKDLENTRLVMYINFMTNGPNEQDYYLDDVSANVFIQYIICIDLVFIVFITVRIELYNLTEQISISKGNIRLIVGLLLIIGVSVVIRLFFPYMPLQDNALYFHIVFTFLLMVFIPFLMIIGNDKMSMFAGIKWPRNSTTSVTPLNV